MDKVNLDDSLRSVLVELQEYLNLQLKYNKMLLAKRMGEIISYLALFLIAIGISGFVLIFLSFAFVTWFNAQYGVLYTGHLIVAGFYMLLILALIIFRKQLIFNPIRKLFGNIMFNEDDDHVEYEEAFKTSQSLVIRIRKYKKLLKKKEEKIGKSFESLSSQFTLSNIFQTVVRNAYNSFVTTSNIARAAYNIVKKFTSSKKKRLKRSKVKNRSGYDETLD